jgi:S-DNA-T family DNA segregation ATPase FtsK/SpoIIIE
VFTLIGHDANQALPAILDQVRLRRNGPVLAAAAEGEAGGGGAGGFVVDREDFRRAPFTPEPPPDGALISRLLKTIGEGAREGRRVEVPFAAVTPPAEKLWSGSTASGIRVPIGRAGADRLQYLDLGRGTAQHALIGGRTGSGKSTLFHVIATNAALWFSPSEVEFYLIDFKHGVEFKTYATAGLPHARVIAIESDREFGLSVLTHINRELNRRGDLFRKHGVQDLGSYRKSGADENLPRILLIIDEFQEFFTEDDVIARDAALLLDRFVRQGRAFGVHAVLGSQTLSGMYTLAKSTLGQMGVRIALQCNEADSHMILSEDNGAARLLTRPGEAIYNDMSGLVEGNSPFQVVWLADEIQEASLRQAVEKARRENYRPAEPMVVFEGNVPAELGRNPVLGELLESPAPAAKAPGPGCGRIWLGEANAIKGPTEIDLLPASGANLLMIGQHREAALAMTCSAAVSLAAANRPEKIRLIAVGADGRDAEGAGALARLAKVLPGGIELPAAREIPKIVGELEARVAAAKEAGKPPEQLVVLAVFGLQRFAALRHEDDFGIAGGEEGASTGERFANVIRDGPEQGVHVLVWCDTLNNANRSFSRKTLREFDLRILFQMSAADSSELIDSAAGANLGLHNALLASQSGGTQEKFRPYTVPEAGYMEELGRAIAKKFGLKAKG